MKILCPLDFSDASVNAIKYASSLFGRDEEGQLIRRAVPEPLERGAFPRAPLLFGSERSAIEPEQCVNGRTNGVAFVQEPGASLSSPLAQEGIIQDPLDRGRE